MTTKQPPKRKFQRFDEYMRNELSDPQNARDYLAVAIEDYAKDKDTESLLLALRDVAEAQCGIAALADKVGLARQSLYKALSGKGNPRLETFLGVLSALNLQLAIVPRAALKKKR